MLLCKTCCTTLRTHSMQTGQVLGAASCCCICCRSSCTGDLEAASPQQINLIAACFAAVAQSYLPITYQTCQRLPLHLLEFCMYLVKV